MDIQTFTKAASLSQKLAAFWYEPITQSWDKFDITDVRDQAGWIAQFGCESNGFSELVENMNYSAEGLMNTFPSYFPQNTNAGQALAKLYEHNPEKIASYVYANRMGNGSVDSGDGYLYRGRGLAMITGRFNYQACDNKLGVGLIEIPSNLEQPDTAALAASWLWDDRKCHRYIVENDFQGLTRVITGSLIGLAQRSARWIIAKKVLGLS